MDNVAEAERESLEKMGRFCGEKRKEKLTLRYYAYAVLYFAPRLFSFTPINSCKVANFHTLR